MIRWWVVPMILVFGVLPVQADTVTDQQIEEGIQKLVARIYSLQNANGTWDGDKPEEGHAGQQYGGKTALAVYALISAGESYQNPKLYPAVQWLSELKMEGTYAVGVRAHVWSHLPERFMPQLREDVYWMLEAIHPVNTGGQSWRYTQESKDWDNSVAQYGVLSLWEGNKRGVPVGTKIWEDVEKHFLGTQQGDGGWSYTLGNEKGTTIAMTTAGLACLYVTQEYVHLQDFKAPGSGREHAIQERIDNGLKWLGENFDIAKSRGGYGLYGVERVGLASGIKYFNGKDWFQSGAAHIIKSTNADLVNASFYLLFLVRGSQPVFINKLEIPGYDWNNRPRDVAHLTEWVSDTMERDMLWQRIPLSASVESWLDAPILYLSSHKPLPFDDEQKAKIKRYIEMGGLLVTSADEGAAAFTESVKAMLKEFYPDRKYKQVAPDDDLLNVVFKVPAKRVDVESIHNGVRHLAIHFPKDISWSLHTSNMADPSLWKFFANTYYYSTEGNPRSRLAAKETKKPGAGAAEVTVARAKYDGNWNPEPMAWSVQSQFMADKAKISTREVDLSNLSDSGAPMVHIVGTDAVEFTDEQVQSLKKYVEGGWLVFFENAGGRSAFGESAIQAVQKAFPDQRFAKVSLSSPLVAGSGGGGYDTAHTDYRLYTVLRTGRIETPRLLVMEINGKPGIIISSDDLSQAMLGQPVWGVFGYRTDSARKLMANAVLYASGQNR